MENFIKRQESKIKEILIECGYEIDDVFLATSSRRDLGEYQYNGAMGLAKIYKKNPPASFFECRRLLYFTSLR